MPSLGADMDEGTVTEWLVHPGDTVRRGDIVAVVDTDKADVDVEIFEDGVIDEILVPTGERVTVGTPLAVVRSSASAPEVARPTEVPAAAPAPVARASIREPAAEPAGTPTADATSSPVLRRLARHLGVDLDDVVGSGPDGAVTRADIEAAAPAAAGSAPVGAERAETAPAPRADDRSLAMRDAIARLMARSKREIPHYYLAADVDFSRSRAWLDEVNAERGVGERLLPAALQLKAVALASRESPEVNGFWVDDRFVAADSVHVGVAISLRGGGLIAPALHDADAKSLDELMRDLRDLVSRAGRPTPELRDVRRHRHRHQSR